MMSSARIFISYRRGDTGAAAHRLADLLANWFGSSVFLDARDIAPGQRFPQEIDAALDAAQAALILIGPKWLDALVERSASTTERDWVVHETRRAVQRHRAGELAALVPVLVGVDARLPALTAPPEAIREAFEHLACCQTFRIDEGTKFGHDAIVDLRWSLVREAGLRYALADEQRQRRAEWQKQLKALLDQPAMRPIGQGWVLAPVGTNDADVPRAISSFRGAVEKAKPALVRLPLEERKILVDTCCEVLALLYRMCVDPGASREWKDASGRSPPVPVATAAAAINVVGAAQGVPFGLAAEVDDPPRIRRAVGLDPADVVDVGSDRRQRLMADIFANTSRYQGELPRPALPASDGARVPKMLRDALDDDADAGMPHLLWMPVARGGSAPEAVRRLAHDLGLPLVLYAPPDLKDMPVLCHDESSIHLRLRNCLAAVNSLLPSETA